MGEKLLNELKFLLIGFFNNKNACVGFKSNLIRIMFLVSKKHVRYVFITFVTIKIL